MQQLRVDRTHSDKSWKITGKSRFFPSAFITVPQHEKSVREIPDFFTVAFITGPEHENSKTAESVITSVRPNGELPASPPIARYGHPPPPDCGLLPPRRGEFFPRPLATLLSPPRAAWARVGKGGARSGHIIDVRDHKKKKTRTINTQVPERSTRQNIPKNIPGTPKHRSTPKNISVHPNTTTPKMHAEVLPNITNPTHQNTQTAPT